MVLLFRLHCVCFLFKSIAVHSDKTTVGSAQGESPTAIKMLGAVSESLTQSSTQESYHGRIHVRVWKPEDLSTLFVMGVGSLQNNIRKMHFMNCRVRGICIC